MSIEKTLSTGSRKLFERNSHVVRKGSNTYRFMCPDIEMYNAQWLWDSCFHIFARRWMDIDFARDEFISLLSGQWENGMIPNMVHINTLKFRIAHFTGRDTSGITQPPLVADAAWSIYQIEKDKGFLKRIFQPLVRYYDWLLVDRDDDGDSLISVYHPWETGIDNSCRWDSIFGEDPEKFRRWKFNIPKTYLIFRFNFAGYTSKKMKAASFFNVEAVDMNCYLYKNLITLSRIADEIGKDGESARLKHNASKVKKAVLDKMWNEKKGAFFDLEGSTERQLKVLTPFALMPLYAGLVDDDTAKILIEHIENPDEFDCRYPIPTVEMKHPGFRTYEYWRGTTWVNINWLLIQGLRRYGRDDLATKISDRTLDMVYKSGFREFYNPFNGNGHGAKHFGWSTLVLDLINSDNYI